MRAASVHFHPTKCNLHFVTFGNKFSGSLDLCIQIIGIYVWCQSDFLDFDYFLFRLDAGLKARDPVRPAGDRWVLTNKPLLWDDLSFNFAIGYPF